MFNIRLIFVFPGPEECCLARRLDRLANELLDKSLSTSTKGTYATAIKHFQVFRAQIKLPIGQLNEQDLLRYIAYLFSFNLKGATIAVYISALRSFYTRNSWGTTVFSTPKVLHTLKATSLSRPSVPNGRPITLDDLRIIQSQLNSSLSDDRCIWAVTCLAFFGLLRGSKYLAKTGRHLSDPSQLTWADISILKDGDRAPRPSAIVINIKHSKTDQSGLGCSKAIFCTKSALCACCAVLNYVARFDGVINKSSPPFIYKSKPLTTTVALKTIRLLLQHRGLNGCAVSLHSFRSGGATTAALVGCPPGIIKSLGSWKSNAFLCYVRPNDSFLCLAQQRMAVGP